MSDIPTYEDNADALRMLFEYFYMGRDRIALQNVLRVPVGKIASLYVSVVYKSEKQVVDEEIWDFLRNKCTMVYYETEITGRIMCGFTVNYGVSV